MDLSITKNLLCAAWCLNDLVVQIQNETSAKVILNDQFHYFHRLIHSTLVCFELTYVTKDGHGLKWQHKS